MSLPRMIYVRHMNRIDIDHNVIYTPAVPMLYILNSSQYVALFHVHSVHM